MKKSKVKTPDWILEGYDSPEEYAKATGKKAEKKVKEKMYRLKVCPKCDSEDIGVILTGKEGESPDGWECRKCKWKGPEPEEIKLNEEEFLKKTEREENEDGR